MSERLSATYITPITRMSSGCRSRSEAIRFAMQMGKPGDVIVLAGKGHETYQDIGGRKLPFDEKVVVRELLSEMELVE